MKRFSLILILLSFCEYVISQSTNVDYFEDSISKRIFFSSFTDGVDYIIIGDANSLKKIGHVRNVPFANPVTFFAPGTYVAIGISTSSEHKVQIMTDPFEFIVDNETFDLIKIEI